MSLPAIRRVLDDIANKTVRTKVCGWRKTTAKYPWTDKYDLEGLQKSLRPFEDAVILPRCGSPLPPS